MITTEYDTYHLMAFAQDFIFCTPITVLLNNYTITLWSYVFREPLQPDTREICQSFACHIDTPYSTKARPAILKLV
jgi:hypothetical protein